MKFHNVSIYKDYREVIQAINVLEKYNIEFTLERIYMYEDDTFLYAIIRNA